MKSENIILLLHWSINRKFYKFCSRLGFLQVRIQLSFQVIFPLPLLFYIMERLKQRSMAILYPMDQELIPTGFTRFKKVTFIIRTHQ